MNDLTQKQKETLELIIQYHLDKNKPISYRKLAQYLGISLKAAYDRIKSIEKKGYIYQDTIARNIKTIKVDYEEED